jgi:uncharacterized membrane protein
VDQFEFLRSLERAQPKRKRNHDIVVSWAERYRGRQNRRAEKLMSDLQAGDVKTARGNPHRFHLPHAHLDSVFGGDWFALKAEEFARFFGTPLFLVAQTVIVAAWIGINVAGWTTFDVYPFILLNLAFSLQAAYAAPLILLAQTRQADRDKAHSLADAQHREELHQVSEVRQLQMEKQTNLLVDMLRQNNALTEQVNTLLEQNTELTNAVRTLVESVKELTVDLHGRLVPKAN